jgi:hypothetical protein
MRLEGFTVIAHFDEQYTLLLEFNYSRKPLVMSLLCPNSFACKCVELVQFSEEVRALGMYQLLSKGPSPR